MLIGNKGRPGFATRLRNEHRTVDYASERSQKSSSELLHQNNARATLRTIQSIDYSEAKKVIDAIVENALQERKAAVIAVADAHGELIALARMDGAPLPSIRVAANKAYTAARERKPTKDIGDKVRHPEKGFDIAYYDDPKFVGWGGGLPVWKNGELIGAIGVSGLPSVEDIALASLGVELIGDARSA